MADNSENSKPFLEKHIQVTEILENGISATKYISAKIAFRDYALKYNLKENELLEIIRKNKNDQWTGMVLNVKMKKVFILCSKSGKYLGPAQTVLSIISEISNSWSSFERILNSDDPTFIKSCKFWIQELGLAYRVTLSLVASTPKLALQSIRGHSYIFSGFNVNNPVARVIEKAESKIEQLS
ncbi:MAG: hypothetical protein IPK10_08015 [Bacteroidetes bacterium]|nr:hypothetical protein [Bacteroidota bacterium]